MSAKVVFYLDSEISQSPLAQIRNQFVNYVHLGRWAPGARLPTVRQVAAETGLNLKTVFRIYRQLAHEDLVDIRPQQGVFVKFSEGAARLSYQKGLAKFLRRVLREARQHNISPLRLSRMLEAEAGLRPGPIRCAVLECNQEQTNLFSQELKRRLNLRAFPVLTHWPPRRRDRALRQADVLITTDFHWQEATRWAAQLHKEVFRIRLNPAFHRMLVENARRGPFPLVLSDVSFEPAFRRAVSATVSPEIAERLILVHCKDRARLREVLRRARRAYVSPLCCRQVSKQIPAGVRLITVQDMISSESLQALRRSGLCR